MADPTGEEPYKIIYATVAQLVEQLIRNQQVDGSNPPGGFVNWCYKSGCFDKIKNMAEGLVL
jgi:hypothetical protein